jgi:hypothetical protein
VTGTVNDFGQATNPINHPRFQELMAKMKTKSERAMQNPYVIILMAAVSLFNQKGNQLTAQLNEMMRIVDLTTTVSAPTRTAGFRLSELSTRIDGFMDKRIAAEERLFALLKVTGWLQGDTNDWNPPMESLKAPGRQGDHPAPGQSTDKGKSTDTVGGEVEQSVDTIRGEVQQIRALLVEHDAILEEMRAFLRWFQTALVETSLALQAAPESVTGHLKVPFKSLLKRAQVSQKQFEEAYANRIGRDIRGLLAASR